MDTYYKPEHLAGFGAIGQAGSPDLARKFFQYYGDVFAEGALSEREKALIALAVAHAVQCPYCIDAYTSECLSKGSDMDQMTEAIHVAVAIRGGASLVHGMQMVEAARKKGM
jgi:4-carboxymuconolactone decarboxylase